MRGQARAHLESLLGKGIASCCGVAGIDEVHEQLERRTQLTIQGPALKCLLFCQQDYCTGTKVFAPPYVEAVTKIRVHQINCHSRNLQQRSWVAGDQRGCRSCMNRLSPHRGFAQVMPVLRFEFDVLELRRSRSHLSQAAEASQR